MTPGTPGNPGNTSMTSTAPAPHANAGQGNVSVSVKPGPAFACGAGGRHNATHRPSAGRLASSFRGRGRRASGFTLIELLASVFIIVVIISITYPIISAIKNGSRVEAGLNTVSMASDVARAWSTASLPQADRGSDPVNPIAGASYSGTAAIFCPTNEVRIVINDQGALDTNGASLEFQGFNGYRDYTTANGGRTDLDYIAIPQGTGVAGIYRFGSGANDVVFMAPPFAVVYDETGTLVVDNVTQDAIFYDGNFDGRYDTSANRTGYDPEDWDRDSVAPDPTTLVRPLGIEVIEMVRGVIIYDATAFKAAGFDFSTDTLASTTSDAFNGIAAQGTEAYAWLRENGTTVFFSTYSGGALRDEGNE